MFKDIILDLDMHVNAKLFNISHKNAGKQLNNQFEEELTDHLQRLRTTKN